MLVTSETAKLPKCDEHTVDGMAILRRLDKYHRRVVEVHGQSQVELQVGGLYSDIHWWYPFEVLISLLKLRVFVLRLAGFRSPTLEEL